MKSEDVVTFSSNASVTMSLTGFFEVRVKLCLESSFGFLLSCSPLEAVPDETEEDSRPRFRDEAEESDADDMVELLSEDCLKKHRRNRFWIGLIRALVRARDQQMSTPFLTRYDTSMFVIKPRLTKLKLSSRV